MFLDKYWEVWKWLTFIHGVSLGVAFWVPRIYTWGSRPALSGGAHPWSGRGTVNSQASACRHSWVAVTPAGLPHSEGLQPGQEIDSPRRLCWSQPAQLQSSSVTEVIFKNLLCKYCEIHMFLQNNYCHFLEQYNSIKIGTFDSKIGSKYLCGQHASFIAVNLKHLIFSKELKSMLKRLMRQMYVYLISKYSRTGLCFFNNTWV